MKLPATYATDVYVNIDGNLCIQQDQARDDRESTTVVLSREQARLVAAEVARLDGDDSCWVPED